MWGKFSIKEFVTGEEDFHKGGTDFLALFKKTMRKYI